MVAIWWLEAPVALAVTVELADLQSNSTNKGTRSG
jgi:hypothetical protein